MFLFGFFKKLVSKGKIVDTKTHTDQDLAEHQHDEGNISLGFQSISMLDGHAGTDVTYYAALRQVIVHSYCMKSHNETTDTIERIPIPDDIALRHSRSEILKYAKDKNNTVQVVCR